MFPAVLALGRCLQVAGRDPQKLSTFHFGSILDFFLFMDSYFLCSFSGLTCYSVETWTLSVMSDHSLNIAVDKKQVKQNGTVHQTTHLIREGL